LPYDGGALVVIDGDLVKVDLSTGTRTLVAQRVVEPGWRCAPVPAEASAFACAAPYQPGGRTLGEPGAIVLSVPAGAAPFVEAWVQRPRFWVSDDGGLLVEGIMECGPNTGCPHPDTFGRGHVTQAPLVRDREGKWHLHVFDLGGSARREGDDMGAQNAPLRFLIVRCVPRGDGAVVAVVRAIDGDEDSWGIAYPDSLRIVRWPKGAPSKAARDLIAYEDSAAADVWTEAGPPDRSWTLTASGHLLGWSLVRWEAGAVEISPDGALRRSATFEALRHAGPVAIAQAHDETLLQTVNHGAAWLPIAAPSRAVPFASSDESRGRATWCSLVGCDFGTWYRVGWAAVPEVRASPEPDALLAAPSSTP
jgi:hypothetical protein